MKNFDRKMLEKLYIPHPQSHKGQNGRLLIIGGSILFHSASLWALTVASRIVDMVFYSSVDQNNQIVKDLKKEFKNGIIVPRERVEDYINEADCILIGPGLPRKEGEEKGDDDTKVLTEKLFKKYPDKKWVIDGGSLQVIEPELIPIDSIITPHKKEFEILKGKIKDKQLRSIIGNLSEAEQAQMFSKRFGCIVLLKAPTDIVCSPNEGIFVKGGNAGMTKGGTGDVLAGLVGALNCKNEPFLSALAGSFINKAAGDILYQKVGLYFNASDLADEIPLVMKELI